MNRYLKPHDFVNDFSRFFNLLEAGNDSATVETSQWRPAVDIIENPTAFVVMADLPGVPTSRTEVSMHNNILTIKGERQMEKTHEKDNYTRSERLVGTFYRQFTLPDTADGENIKAKSRHGVLEITIPKHEKAKKRRIDISIEE